MNELDRKLYELLGNKTLSFGCKFQMRFPDAIHKDWIETYLGLDYKDKYIYPCRNSYDAVLSGANPGYLRTISDSEVRQSVFIEIIGHEPTISDLHRWMNDNTAKWTQEEVGFSYHFLGGESKAFLYDSSKSLLSQSEETKSLIVNLIESYERQSLPRHRNMANGRAKY